MPARVIFGFDTKTRTGDEIRRLGSKRPLVHSTPGHRTEAEALGAQLGMDFAGVFAEATMHTPIEVTEWAMAAVHETRADGLIAFGGGYFGQTEGRLLPFAGFTKNVRHLRSRVGGRQDVMRVVFGTGGGTREGDQ